jgi:hypothetical protein
MCHKLGYRLEIQGDYLRLINHKNEVISAVKIHYADTALTDIDGKPIQAYIFEASTDGTHIVFTHGDNTYTSLTVPYSERAKEDVNGKDLMSYIYRLSVSGNNLLITYGSGEQVEITVPYAISAKEDVNGKDLVSYGAELAVDGDKVVLRDSLGREIDSITVPFATKAQKDVLGNDFRDYYGSEITTGVTTIKLVSPNGIELSEITVPYSTKAKYDEDGNEIDTFYGHSLSSVNGYMQLKDSHGTVLSSAEILDFGAITQVSVVGDQVVFTNRAGNTIQITVPYAVKAMKDDLGNNIKNTYVASVTNDTQTGALNFYDATGVLIATLLPTVQSATEDNYGNQIADYIKQIIIDNQSDYVLAVHGDGTTDSLTINYSNTAWKDTNGNIIKNSYIKRLEFIEDPNDHHMKLVGYNGDTPEAEVCRVDMQTDLSELPYGVKLNIEGGMIQMLDPNGNLLSEVELPKSESHPVTILDNEFGGVPIAVIEGNITKNSDILTDPNKVADVNNKSFTMNRLTNYSIIIGQYNGTNVMPAMNIRNVDGKIEINGQYYTARYAMTTKEEYEFDEKLTEVECLCNDNNFYELKEGFDYSSIIQSQQIQSGELVGRFNQLVPCYENISDFDKVKEGFSVMGIISCEYTGNSSSITAEIVPTNSIYFNIDTSNPFKYKKFVSGSTFLLAKI